MFIGLMIFCSGCNRKPAHGVEFLVEVHSPQINDADFQHTVGAVRKRLDAVGHPALLFEAGASNHLRIVFPVLPEADIASVRNQITNSAVLEFRLVHSDSDKLIQNDVTPPGWELLKCKRRAADGTEKIEPVIVNKEPAGGLTGRAIKSALVGRDLLGRSNIGFQLSPEGTRLFAEVTRSNVGQRLAMVLNGEILSTPVIKSPIEAGYAEISGDFGEREAIEITSLFQNPLSAPVTILSERSF
jgi:SecD/SecF fusion protein